MKTLVVYYSLDGHCDLVAREIRSQQNADLLRLETVDEKKRTGLAKFVWGGRQVLTHRKPALQPYIVRPGDYDLIILGGPVWAGSPAPALYSFLEATAIREKRLALFCCCGGGPGRFFEKLTSSLGTNTIAGKITLVNPGKDSAQTREQIAAWLKTLAP